MMVNDVIKSYVCALNREHDAFWIYMDILEKDSDNKALIMAIMNDELQHYDKLKDLIFQASKQRTALEQAMYAEYNATSSKMHKLLESRK